MWIDIGLLAFIVYGFFLGYSRGIIKSIFAILSILIAIALSMQFSPFVIEILEDILKLDPQLNLIVGFLLTFVVIVFIIRLIGKALEKFIKKKKLNFMNKMTGGVLMVFLFVITYGYLLGLLNQINVLSEIQKSQSVSYEQMSLVPEKTQSTLEKLKPIFNSFWEKTKEATDVKNLEKKDG